MTLSAPADLSATSSAEPKKDITRLVVATSVGNALEWYDIAVYGYFAVYISKAFFPNNDPTTSLLLTFGLSYVMVEVVRLLWGKGGIPFDTPDLLQGAVDIGVGYFPLYRLFVIGVAAAVMLALWLLIERTRMGLAGTPTKHTQKLPVMPNRNTPA